MKRRFSVCLMVLSMMLCSSASYSLERFPLPSRPTPNPAIQLEHRGAGTHKTFEGSTRAHGKPGENFGPVTEAPTGFDLLSNGLVDQETYMEDLERFDEFVTIKDGLGPLYNAQSCRECHQNPISGSGSQVTEMRAGHVERGIFHNPVVPIMHGEEFIINRSLINDRAICPSGQFPNSEIQERVPLTETIITFRISLSLLGDGFVEAVEDQTLIDLSENQSIQTNGTIHGQILYVPIMESPGQMRVGRFGWKNQHGSLLSFSADAYLNEMGISNRLMVDEITDLCRDPHVTNPNAPGNDIDMFAEFIRSTKAPARDSLQAQTKDARLGEKIFLTIGCSLCHVPDLKTARTGKVINGDKLTIPEALGNKIFHPYGDFLLHNIGTGDGIVQSWIEHYGRNILEHHWPGLSAEAYNSTQYKMRTAPLWGVRLRSRLMHDGESLTFMEAIERHRGEASLVTMKFLLLPDSSKLQLFEFLKSL